VTLRRQGQDGSGESCLVCCHHSAGSWANNW